MWAEITSQLIFGFGAEEIFDCDCQWVLLWLTFLGKEYEWILLPPGWLPSGELHVPRVHAWSMWVALHHVASCCHLRKEILAEAQSPFSELLIYYFQVQWMGPGRTTSQSLFPHCGNWRKRWIWCSRRSLQAWRNFSSICLTWNLWGKEASCDSGSLSIEVQSHTEPQATIGGTCLRRVQMHTHTHTSLYFPAPALRN